MAVVLVHGSFVNATVWAPIADALRQAGHRVEVTELHRGSLAGDVRAAQESVDSAGGPVVVCGWSYGGNVITGLVTPPGSHLVYLCAMLPDEGESAISLGTEHPGGIDVLLSANDDGDLVLSGDDLDEILWGDAPPEAAATARASLGTQSMASFLDPTTTVAWRSTPSTLVVGRSDRVYNRTLMDLMATRATNVTEWDTSHSPVLSRPDLVVELLRGLDPEDSVPLA